MAVIKCKMCGGDIEIAPDKTFGTCEYCGSTMTLPKIDDDQRAAAFNRGNHFRRQGEFDKALAVYERIVAEDDTDAEAHWCCALCRFGIEYVEDPATYEYIPTCHRASFDSILEDVDYLAAVEHSDGITKRQYQKDAAKIAEVQRGILATSQKEEPFDVFICYKETDADTGERSRDSIDAQEVYYQLTEKGYRVFFARITLEDKAGAEYEPYIFAALNSAKVMIVLGEKAAHFSAVWVKNEWSRYLSLMKRDRSRLLLPCYKNMDPYDLPEQLAVLQSYDMGKIGFMQDLIRGVEKVLRKDEPKEAAPTQPVVQQTVVQSAGGANLTAQLKRGQQALEDHDWQAADTFFDKALDMDAECAEAFFGKALAEAQCSNGAELITERSDNITVSGERLDACDRDEERIERVIREYAIPGYLSAQTIKALFKYDKRDYGTITPSLLERIEEEKEYWTQDRLMSRAVRFAKGDFAEEINRIQSAIQNALQEHLSTSKAADEIMKADAIESYTAEMEKAEQRAKTAYEKADQQRLADYQAYCEFQENAKTEYDFNKAEHHLSSEGMQGFKDCDERARQCHAEAEKRKATKAKAAQVKKARRTKGWAVAVAAIIVIAVAYLAAVKVFVPLIHLKGAEALLNAGNYDEAIAVFSELGDFRNSSEMLLEAKYQKAEELQTTGYKEAAILFGSLGEYRDAKSKSMKCWDEIAIRNTIAAGDCHSIGLRTDGSVVAKGEGNSGQCNVSDWHDIIAIDACGYQTAGLQSDGKVIARGWRAAVFDEWNTTDWTDIVAVAAGTGHTLGLRSDGTVVSDGSNSWGETLVSDWKDIIAIEAGSAISLGIRDDGTVVAAGNNSSGQCDVSEWTDIIEVSTQGNHTVGLRNDGTVVCVGENDYGQCNVSEWTDIVAISAGGNFTVGVKKDGTVVATGSNDHGQCNVSEWKDVVAVSAGWMHTLGLKSDGTVIATGFNNAGQCNVNRWTSIQTPDYLE